MNIAFPIIIASSGSDIYYKRLCDHLPQKGINARIIPHSYAYEFLPLLNRLTARTTRVFDLIHTNAEYAHLFHVRGKPLVVTLHHNVLDPYYQKFTTLPQKIYHYGLLRRRLGKSLAASAGAVCVSTATQQSFSELFPEYRGKLTVIYNGIDSDLFKPMPDKYPTQKRLLLFVGNLSRRKGADLLAPIMEKLGGSYELLCIGKKKPELIFPSNIKNIPFVEPLRLPEYYNRAEMLLFPSRLEGFGYAVAEAMACGRPVVCGNRSSLPELIDDGKGGFLCDPDDVSAFVEKIRCIAETPGLAAAMGAYNREKAQRLFTTHNMVSAYAEIYQRCLQ